MRSDLEDFCAKEGLYLDCQENRRHARPGRRLSWTDDYGNAHDLDYVIERGGTDQRLGDPVAFIEIAWRRYTKHSKNKAQEIQGAIKPLADKYHFNSPFLGVVLAGEFTEGSLEQLSSLGFKVLHFSYDSVVEAFSHAGIDISFDEDTPDSAFSDAVDQFEALGREGIQSIEKRLIEIHRGPLERFFMELRERFSRCITKVLIVPLYGSANEFSGIEDAITFLNSHVRGAGSTEFQKYEIRVEFSNGDSVGASYSDKDKAMHFLSFVASQ